MYRKAQVESKRNVMARGSRRNRGVTATKNRRPRGTRPQTLQEFYEEAKRLFG